MGYLSTPCCNDYISHPNDLDRVNHLSGGTRRADICFMAVRGGVGCYVGKWPLPDEVLPEPGQVGYTVMLPGNPDRNLSNVSFGGPVESIPSVYSRNKAELLGVKKWAVFTGED